MDGSITGRSCCRHGRGNIGTMCPTPHCPHQLVEGTIAPQDNLVLVLVATPCMMGARVLDMKRSIFILVMQHHQIRQDEALYKCRLLLVEDLALGSMWWCYSLSL